VDGSPPSSSDAASAERDPDDMKLYVGNLPNSCTDDDLKAAFSKAGRVDEVEVKPCLFLLKEMQRRNHTAKQQRSIPAVIDIYLFLAGG
jgi:RNA recognition motif-containing protein